MSRTQEDIKKELEALLQSHEIDYSRVLSLSNELASLDKTHIRFTVDAGIINRLGKELVGRGETAISELIKNAYDADASYVNLVFKNALSLGGTLVIEDDGLGMSYEELINGFMRISSSDKIHRPVSPIYSRKRAGKKGIGRFATQRLGNQLVIESQTLNAENAIRATINWDEFGMDSDLNEIACTIDFFPKEREKGTTLYINQLRDVWSDASILRAYRYTENLLIPEPLSSERKEWDNSRQDPGFSASFFRDTVSETTKVVDENIAFYDHALALIEGYIDEQGQGFWRMSSKLLGVQEESFRRIGKERDDPSSHYSYARSIRFKTYYFIYDRSLIPGPLFTYIKNLGSEIGGIRIYRNGFRVSPYGEKNNDWVGLDESVSRRSFIFPHQNQSFFGYVEIEDSVADLFEETSSREGLIENEAFHEIRDFVYRTIITACTEIAALRSRKHKANQKDWEKKPSSQIIQEALDDFSKLVDSEENNKGYSDNTANNDRFKAIYNKLVEGQREQETEKEKLWDENSMLRVFAGLGLTIGEFIHEIKYYFPGFSAEISYLNTLLSSNQEAKKRLDLLDENLMSMKSYTTFFDDAISENARRILEPISLKYEIKRFEDVIERDRKKAGIEVLDNRDKDDVLLADMKTVPMHPSEWASIFFNLYSNAKKAIKRSENSVNGKILIECFQNDKSIILHFSDNGTGVDPNVRDRIFDAFVTTTSAAPQNSTDGEVYTGTGLGLSILRDIISSYNGTICLLETPKEGYKTTFQIEIPRYKV